MTVLIFDLMVLVWTVVVEQHFVCNEFIILL